MTGATVSTDAAAGADAPPGHSRGRAATGVFVSILGIALVLLGVFAVQLRRESTGPGVGDQAPDFELETFDGETVRLSDLRGKVVVVNFWASWCVPCALEAADLEAVWRDYREQGVVVVGVDYVDTRPAALAYLEQHDVTYPNGPDRQDVISRRYRLAGVPETFVIDQEGRIVPLLPRGGGDMPLNKIVGPIAPNSEFTPDDLRHLLDRLIAESEP